jgi:alpha-galactosidase
MRKKIVIIGAGSVMFIQGLVMDLIKKKPGGLKWKLAIVDINGEVLDDIYGLVMKMIQGKQSDIELERSTDRCDVLPGADYVVVTVGVGGRRAAEQDVFIPRKYGIYQPGNDTAMAGGISYAMRMVPVMLDITRDVQRLCPQASFFNYSDPMTIICRAIKKKLDYDAPGLCIGTAEMEWYIADLMGWEWSRVTTLAAGVNHCTFIYEFRLDGKDAWPLIREKVLASDLFEIKEPFSWEFFLRYGAFPACGDPHISVYFADQFPHGAYYGKTMGLDVFSFENRIVRDDKALENFRRLARSPEPLAEEFYTNFRGEAEQVIDIIDSMERDSRKMYYMNVQNNSAIPNLPPWAIVEMPTIAAAAGPLPVHLGNFPDIFAAYTARFLSVIEIAVDAAVSGSRLLMEEAILAGGYISDRAAVHKMVEELLQAQKKYLPHM